jgi:pimeloyl-ACP methyl ester carboxylesterase
MAGCVAMRRIIVLALALAAASPALAVQPPARQCAFVLHGFGRGPGSVRRLANRLSQAGYAVYNVDYPSMSEDFPRLVSRLAARVAAEAPGCAEVNFVSYSMGGLLVRDYLANHAIAQLGRVVMIGPPNHGSEIVDSLGGGWLFRKLLGPVAARLGTGPDSIPNRLGPPDFPLGVIAGDRVISPIGWLLLPRPCDGTVSVASARLDGMADFLLVHRSHTFMIDSREIADQTIAFLRQGRFDRHATG